MQLKGTRTASFLSQNLFLLGIRADFTFHHRRIDDAKTGHYPEINDVDFKCALSNNI